MSEPLTYGERNELEMLRLLLSKHSTIIMAHMAPGLKADDIGVKHVVDAVHNCLKKDRD